ncbi:MAG: hypothetical protein IJK14_04725 [Clostridia bacterium]|nr:hypothetical protein [Clostridia bacterium]MBR0444668.1 hypothetical protein [Clostridia bacterium]
MKFTKRKGFGDRIDADLIRGLDGMHVIMPLMMKNRTDNEAFLQVSVETEKLDAWLRAKNDANPEHRYTIFQAVLAAVGRTVQMRPRMNTFIKGERYYQRNSIQFSFIAKKAFSDTGEEAIAIMDYDPESTKSSIDEMHDKLCAFVYDLRHNDKTDATTDIIGSLNKLPFFIFRFVIWLLSWLDNHGIMPKALLKEDPYASTVFLSNIGSLKLAAGYHHLANWGTNSVFIILGEECKAEILQPDGTKRMTSKIDMGITLDERIADGYYFAKTARLINYLLNNPELLDKPCCEEIVYEEK